MTVTLPSDLEVVFTNHAEARLIERTGLGLDEARSEIEAALAARRAEWRAKAIFYLWTPFRQRVYSVAYERRRGRLIVLTVLTPLPIAAAA